MKPTLAVGYVRSHDPNCVRHDEWTAQIEAHADTYSLDLREIYRDDLFASVQGPQRPGFSALINDLSRGAASVVVVPGVQHLSYDRPTCQTLAAAIAAAGGVLHVIDMPAARPTLRTPRTEWIQ